MACQLNETDHTEGRSISLVSSLLRDDIDGLCSGRNRNCNGAPRRRWRGRRLAVIVTVLVLSAVPSLVSSSPPQVGAIPRSRPWPLPSDSSIRPPSTSERHFSDLPTSCLVLRGGDDTALMPATFEEDEDFCRSIRHTLNVRLDQVLTGTRARHFARHYDPAVDKIDGIYTRGHGRSVLEKETATVEEIMEDQLTKIQCRIDSIMERRERENDGVWPTDMTSLELTTARVLASGETATAAKQDEERALEQLDKEERPPTNVELVLRALKIGFNFCPVIVTSWIAYLFPKFREKLWYDWVGDCLAKSGPAFIKWGQWASTRTDMFPESLCASLSNLHADAPAHSWEHTQTTVESALKIPPGKLFNVFESFERSPVASGSIAQVHRAILRSDEDANGHGTLVAVKVRHPNVSRLIEMDFRLMSFVADLVDRVPSLRYLGIRDSVEQFSHTMAAQAHLNVEAHHLEVLNYNFRHWPGVQFPKPIFASGGCIVETFEVGRIVTDVLDRYDQLAEDMTAGPTVEEPAEEGDEAPESLESATRPAGHELVPVSLSKFLVTTGVSVYLKMLLVDNLMHADLHPGNIMLDVGPVLEEGVEGSSKKADVLIPVGGGSTTAIKESLSTKTKMTSWKERRCNMRKKIDGCITLVDAGMVARLDEEESVNFIGLLAAIGEGDGQTAAESVLRFSSPAIDAMEGECNACDGSAYNPQLNSTQRDAFASDMVEFFQEKCRGYGTDVEVGEVLRGVLSLVRKHHVKIDANYATLVINLLCIEGMAQRVCPSYNVLDSSKPLLRSYRNFCHDEKETGRTLCRPSSFRRSMLKLWIPVMYRLKDRADGRFFRNHQRLREEEQRRRREENGGNAYSSAEEETPRPLVTTKSNALSMSRSIKMALAAATLVLVATGNNGGSSSVGSLSSLLGVLFGERKSGGDSTDSILPEEKDGSSARERSQISELLEEMLDWWDKNGVFVTSDKE